MGNVSSNPPGAGHCADCMPGSFPEDLPPDADPPSLQQGVKRQRRERSQKSDGAAFEAPPALKKTRILPHQKHAIYSRADFDANDSPEDPSKQHRRTPVASISIEQALREKFFKTASLGPVSTLRTHDLPEAAKDAVSLEHGYEMLEKLGASTEGAVYLKKSKRNAELIAVKVLKRKARSRDVADLPIECLLHLILGWHPHIVFLMQIDIIGDGVVQMGMSYANAGDLIDYLKRRERYSTSEFNHKAFVVHLLVQLGEALAFLHHGLRRVGLKGEWPRDPGWESATHSLILGDLKPENIVLDFSPGMEFGLLPEVKICDFGHTALSLSPLRLAGSPLYHPPELAAAEAGLKGPPMSTASDVWTFGATLYFMITGKIWKSNRNSAFLTLPAEYDKLGFTRLLKMCLQTNPNRRPTFDCHLGHGIVPVIEHAWDVRADLMWKTKTGERDWWNDWRKEVQKGVKARS